MLYSDNLILTVGERHHESDALPMNIYFYRESKTPFIALEDSSTSF